MRLFSCLSHRVSYTYLVSGGPGEKIFMKQEEILEALQSLLQLVTIF